MKGHCAASELSILRWCSGGAGEFDVELDFGCSMLLNLENIVSY